MINCLFFAGIRIEKLFLNCLKNQEGGLIAKYKIVRKIENSYSA